jgi:hypothetical protein
MSRAPFVLQLGDHIAVETKEEYINRRIFHHGIYIGNFEDEIMIVDENFVDPSDRERFRGGVAPGIIEKKTFESFCNPGYDQYFFIIAHQQDFNYPITEVHRKEAVKIAKSMIGKTTVYDLAYKNYDDFCDSCWAKRYNIEICR